MSQTLRSAVSAPAARLLIAGAAGRLGESLLAAALASPRYPSVTVLTRGPLASTASGLNPLPVDRLLAVSPAEPDRRQVRPPSPTPAEQPRAAILPSAPGALEVIISLTAADDPFAHAHNGRDSVYAAVTDLDTLRRIAHAASELGATRLLLIAPLAAWQQMSAAGRMLPEGLEMELANLPIPAIIILRPTTEQANRHQVFSDAATTRPESALARFARFYLSQLRFMLPSAARPMRSNEIAGLALAVLTEHSGDGLHIVPLERMQPIAEPVSHRTPAP